MFLTPVAGLYCVTVSTGAFRVRFVILHLGGAALNGSSCWISQQFTRKHHTELRDLRKAEIMPLWPKDTLSSLSFKLQISVF